MKSSFGFNVRGINRLVIGTLLSGCLFLFSREALPAPDGYLKHIGVANYLTTANYTANYGDVDFQVVMKRRLTDNPKNGNCILFRGTVDPLDDPQGRWYSYYGFFYSTDGYYWISKVVQGGAPIFMQGQTQSAEINQGDDWNNLRVRAQGSNLEFYINGVLTWSGTDTDLTSGQVGFGMYSATGDAPNEMLIDSASLTGEFDFQFDCLPGGLNGWQFHFGSWTICSINLPLLLKSE